MALCGFIYFCFTRRRLWIAIASIAVILNLVVILPWYFNRPAIVESDRYAPLKVLSNSVLQEFRDYAMVVLLSLLAFLISVTVGISFLLGSIVYAAFSAYAHQLQHENPTKCFWMEDARPLRTS